MPEQKIVRQFCIDSASCEIVPLPWRWPEIKLINEIDLNPFSGRRQNDPDAFGVSIRDSWIIWRTNIHFADISTQIYLSPAAGTQLPVTDAETGTGIGGVGVKGYVEEVSGCVSLGWKSWPAEAAVLVIALGGIEEDEGRRWSLAIS